MIDPVRTRNIPVERIFMNTVCCPFPLDSHQKARFLELSMPTQKNAPAFAAGAKFSREGNDSCVSPMLPRRELHEARSIPVNLQSTLEPERGLPRRGNFVYT